MNKRAYIGSAHHLAYTSMVLGMLPMMYLMIKAADGSYSLQRMVALLILGGVSLTYLYNLFSTIHQDCSQYHKPQPINPLLLSALLVSMGITGIMNLLWLVMILMRVDRYDPQPVPVEDYAIFISLSASMICGMYTIYKMCKLNRLYRRSQGNV